MTLTRSETPGAILVVAETSDCTPIRLTHELLGLARRLASASGGAVCAAVLSDCRPEDAEALIARGADRVLVVPQPEPGVSYESDVWLAGLQATLACDPPALILLGHTTLGADLAPRLAFRLKVAVATACERIELADGKVRTTRPCYGNKAREVLTLNTTPAVATVRPKMYEALAPDAARRGEIVKLAAVASEPRRTQIIARQKEDIGASAKLESASIIIAGGRGLGGAEGFTMLEQLASVLGGAVGASRVACDLGWCPHSWQIGLTGRTVTPDLYIAVGISGASHHMAGCGNSKAILAINSDAEAAIFTEARFGIVGDYREIVPALTEEITKRRKTELRDHESSP
jgi:electron transfer flavoprotein alpha subunit